jgi:hypothetical protein
VVAEIRPARHGTGRTCGPCWSLFRRPVIASSRTSSASWTLISGEGERPVRRRLILDTSVLIATCGGGAHATSGTPSVTLGWRSDTWQLFAAL